MDTRHLAGLRVLAVDDNAPSRQLLSLLFDSAGAQVDQAEDGDEAVRMCALEPFDAVLMDLQMPVMDGIQATRLIRAHEARTPSRSRMLIVGVTAHALAEYRELCLTAGMDLVITKPIDPETILLRIGALLQDRPPGEAAN